ncbi:uncharacterized protein LOC143424013 [Xylocopa sonorina]|uniref:uncharacterized protein LOC143424013 n=1 Tax=Xylocopa sonorina TaxID=1818115 RepID=UPI00403A9DD9
MKLCLSVVLATLAATLLLHSTEYAAANSTCPQENCLDASKCKHLLVGGICPKSSDTCCSVVKTEYRTYCRHFGGICMDWCNQDLQRTAIDCPSDQVCCPLV